MIKHVIQKNTMKQVAAKANVSIMTVSLALRNHPRIPLKTRRRIQKIAKTMGYCLNPLLSKLFTYCRTRKTNSLGNLAWMENTPSEDHWKNNKGYQENLLGASERAQELGYRLERFWMKSPGITKSGMEKFFVSKNIQGLLFPPAARAQTHLHLDWPRFSCVTIGYSIISPRMHQVAIDKFQCTTLTVRKLRSLGYRRIGLALDPLSDAAVRYQYKAGFLVEQDRFKFSDKIPLFYDGFCEKKFHSWFLDFKPEAIVTPDWEVFKWLKAMGVRVPQDVGVAIPNNANPEIHSGVQVNDRLIGGTAVDLLANLLYHQEKGLPQFPHRILFEGEWVAGKTARRVNVSHK